MRNRLNEELASFSQYARAYEEYKSRGVDRTLNPTDPEWRGTEVWRTQHYFDVGEDALRIVITALASARRPFPKRILDFPSGSGRVTRHLRAFFPTAELWVSDIDNDHLRFCAAQFDAKTVPSRADLTEVTFNVDFDLVFCGSLLTHLPSSQAEATLSLAKHALSANGIGIVTMHGRHSSYIQRNKWKYIDDSLFAMAERQAAKTGFGFVEYPHNMRSSSTHGKPYGLSLSKPSWVLAQLEKDPTVRILGYREKDWVDHQDVVIIGRPGIDE